MVRLLCLTVIPHGGSLAPALKKLGFLPYSLRSAFQGANVRSHPEEWSSLLSGTKPLNDLSFLKHYDCLIGPPSSVMFDRILKVCPPFTKVILVEEPYKKQWAETYEKFIDNHRRTISSGGGSSGERVRRAYHSLLERMMVGSDTASSAAPPFTGSNNATRHHTPDRRMTNSCNSALLRVEALEKFEQNVRLTVPKSRLLVFRNGDDWRPLCQFLGVEPRSEPFPTYHPASDDYGMQTLRIIEDRLDRVKLLHFLVKVAAFCAIGVFFQPYFCVLFQSGISTYTEYQRAYADSPTLSP